MTKEIREACEILGMQYGGKALFEARVLDRLANMFQQCDVTYCDLRPPGNHWEVIINLTAKGQGETLELALARAIIKCQVAIAGLKK